MNEVAVPHVVTQERDLPAFSANDLFELVAISVLGPASWIVPRRMWHLVTLALSSSIAILRPDVTRWRMRRLRTGLAGRPIQGSLFGLRVRIIAGYMEERMQLLREYRPGGWRGRIELTGESHLTEALERGRGAVLWSCPFTHADLVVKTALARAGHSVNHLSARSRGFQPNHCHPWTPTRFGNRYLSRLRTSVEDRYLEERILMPRDGSLGYVRRLERILRGNEILSIRAGAFGHGTAEAPILGGHQTLATGAPSLAVATGAALLPVFLVRHGRGRFEVVIEPPMEAATGLTPRAACEDLIRRYTERLETYVLRSPELWSGWYFMRLPERET